MTNILHTPGAWDSIAGSYNASVRTLLGPLAERALQWSEIDGNDDVLDVACGPGTLAIKAARVAQSVNALDFSPGMIEMLQKNIGLMSNLAGHVGNGQALPFEDDTFSLAFSMFGVILFPDADLGLREIFRVLRPGGQVILGAWPPQKDSPIMSAFGAAFARAVPPVADVDTAVSPLPFSSIRSLKEGLGLAGFTEIEVLEIHHEVPIHGGRHFWELMNGSPVVRQLQERAGEDWGDIETRIIAELEHGVSGVESLAMPALLGRGLRPKNS